MYLLLRPFFRKFRKEKIFPRHLFADDKEPSDVSDSTIDCAHTCSGNETSSSMETLEPPDMLMLAELANACLQSRESMDKHSHSAVDALTVLTMASARCEPMYEHRVPSLAT